MKKSHSMFSDSQEFESQDMIDSQSSTYSDVSDVELRREVSKIETKVKEEKLISIKHHLETVNVPFPVNFIGLLDNHVGHL